MSPAMLTLVAAVLAYDIARDMWEARSSMAEAEEVPRCGRRRGVFPSRIERSCTKLENDILSILWKGKITQIRRQVGRGRQ